MNILKWNCFREIDGWVACEFPLNRPRPATICNSPWNHSNHLLTWLDFSPERFSSVLSLSSGILCALGASYEVHKTGIFWPPLSTFSNWFTLWNSCNLPYFICFGAPFQCEHHICKSPLQLEPGKHNEWALLFLCGKTHTLRLIASSEFGDWQEKWAQMPMASSPSLSLCTRAMANPANKNLAKGETEILFNLN